MKRAWVVPISNGLIWEVRFGTRRRWDVLTGGTNEASMRELVERINVGRADK